MKVVYSYVNGNPIQYIPTGVGHQRILLWFEDGMDWYVFFCDDTLSKVYLHRVINKMKPPHEVFSMFNLETIEQEPFDKYMEWINDNYNYQGLHKGEQVDG